MDFIEDKFGVYKALMFLPFIGLFLVIFILIMGLIVTGLEYLYDKLIKNIKI